jgi:lipopolysaccharide/colanic/teichoic acid biosynthesis glycosyltransferase
MANETTLETLKKYNGFAPALFIEESTEGCEKTYFLKTSDIFNIDNLDVAEYDAIINIQKLNDINDLNEFQKAINAKLKINGLYVGKVETNENSNQRIKDEHHPITAPFFTVFDFIFRRVFPRMPVLRGIHQFITKGKNRCISSCEAIGRLYYCGFEVIDTKAINNNLYFVAKKVKETTFVMEKLYGPLFIMRRVSKNNKIIKVYKLRTMHPYAEYVQEYLFNKSNLAEGGKFNDDFRVTSYGMFFRKFWIDELPMIINVLKLEIKLVGVRPLSTHFLSLYSPELQQLRTKVKPGLLPPFYADMPKTLEDIMQSEIKYINDYQKNGILCDLRYFYKIIVNIVIKKKRSS